MSSPLDPFGVPVQVGPVTLRTPGLSGAVDVHFPGADGMRAAEQVTRALEDAFALAGLETQLSVEITGTAEVAVSGISTRSAGFDEPAIELVVPGAGDDWGQVVVAVDEAGVVTWNFARDDRNRIETTRGPQPRTFLIRRRVAHPPEQAGRRGAFGAIGRKILKVVAFRLMDKVAGAVGERLAARWEAQRRPYRMRPFTPGDYRSADVGELTHDDWARLAEGRALLMLHGTFSRSDLAFAGLPDAFVQTLHDAYNGRVFAFDHFTLSDDPARNAERFVELMPADARVDLDIVCHSRGGLLARQLAERAAGLPPEGRHLRVGRVVFVAVPNAGTTLVDTKYMNDFIDSYTTILNLLPDNGVTDVLEAIVTVVKQLAVGAVRGLDGLQAMLPTGEFLRSLNQGGPGDARYFALASNYEPRDSGWKDYAVDHLMDKIFKQANDLVVPTAGVFAANGSGRFPIQARHVFSQDDAVAHTTFFEQATTRAKMIEWLTAS